MDPKAVSEDIVDEIKFSLIDTFFNVSPYPVFIILQHLTKAI